MKAKTMAGIFKANPSEETVWGLIKDEIRETKELSLVRKVSSDSGMTAILKEADDRWRAFAKLCPEVNPDAFKISIHKLVPLTKELL